jgi:hypothetical protein
MADVIPFITTTDKPRPAGLILAEAARQMLREVVVIGRDADGKLWALSSDPHIGNVFVLLEQAKAGYLDRL